MGDILAGVAEDESAARALTERTRAVARLLAADIERLSDEYPQYDRDVVAGLFRVLYTATDHVPTYREARERMERYSETMSNAKLRRLFATGRDQAFRPDDGAKKGSAPGLRHAPQHGHGRAPSPRITLPVGWAARVPKHREGRQEARTIEHEVTPADQVILRYGDGPGGSLTFHDGDGIRRTVRGGEEFETDRATGQVLMKGDPRVRVVPRIELDLRRVRPDLTPERIRELVIAARAHLESLGDMATPQAIRAEVERSAPPAAGLPTTKTGRRIGRPKGTRAVPRDRLIERYRSLRKNSGRAPTQDELARSLDPPIKVRTLQDHLTAYDLPWPIE